MRVSEELRQLVDTALCHTSSVRPATARASTACCS